jgi:hypothetical protein
MRKINSPKGTSLVGLLSYWDFCSKSAVFQVFLYVRTQIGFLRFLMYYRYYSLAARTSGKEEKVLKEWANS